MCLLLEGSYTVDEIESILNESDGSGILLLFDGAEYMPDALSDAMSELSEVICGKRWPKCSVVLTSNFVHDFNDRNDEILFENSFFFNDNSKQPWTRYNLIGFTTDDVIIHAQSYFEHFLPHKSVLFSRKFLDFCRVFQRDVYTGVSTSPAFTFLLASSWRKRIGKLFRKYFGFV